MRYALVAGLVGFGALAGCASTTPPVVAYQAENVISFSSKDTRVTPEMRDLAAKHCTALGTNASYKGQRLMNIWTDEREHDFTCELGKVEIIE